MTLPALKLGDLGTDIDFTTDIGLRWNLATGRRNLGNALARRLSTPRGTLDYDPDYGFDLRDSLSAGLTRTQLAQLRASIVDECEKDERVDNCDADVIYNPFTSGLTVNLTVTTADGPFDLILLVTSVTVALLNHNQPTQPLTPGQVGVTVNIGVPGPQGLPGVGVPGAGGSGGGTMDLTFPKRMGSNAGGQEVVGQVTADFANVPAGTITVDMTALALSVSGTATIRLWVGGTSNAVDGSLVGTTTIAVSTDTQIQISATFANPTGVRFVKLTIQSSAATVDAQVADALISFH